MTLALHRKGNAYVLFQIQSQFLCHVAAMLLPADSDGFPICIIGFEGRVITEEGGIIHLTL